MTSDVDKNDVDTVLDPCYILSFDQFSRLDLSKLAPGTSATRHYYFTRYAYHTKQRYFSPVAMDWAAMQTKDPVSYKLSVRDILVAGSPNKRKRRMPVETRATKKTRTRAAAEMEDRKPSIEDLMNVSGIELIENTEQGAATTLPTPATVNTPAEEPANNKAAQTTELHQSQTDDPSDNPIADHVVLAEDTSIMEVFAPGDAATGENKQDDTEALEIPGANDKKTQDAPEEKPAKRRVGRPKKYVIEKEDAPEPKSSAHQPAEVIFAPIPVNIPSTLPIQDPARSHTPAPLIETTEQILEHPPSSPRKQANGRKTRSQTAAALEGLAAPTPIATPTPTPHHVHAPSAEPEADGDMPNEEFHATAEVAIAAAASINGNLDVLHQAGLIQGQQHAARDTYQPSFNSQLHHSHLGSNEEHDSPMPPPSRRVTSRLQKKKQTSVSKAYLQTPTRKIVVKAQLQYARLPTRPVSDSANSNGQNEDDEFDDLPGQQQPTIPPDLPDHAAARALLHVSTVPDALPCRDDEFSKIFMTLESAIRTQTGSCLYVSGTPGTGKTATVREVIAQLQLRVGDAPPNNLPPFKCVEINGMKLINPQEAYEVLWQSIKNQRVSSTNAVSLLEKELKSKQNADQRQPVLVIMDELDQLVTKSQNVVYNFFNWPALPNSKLIVVAIANIMDLPERTFTNKISSRLGLTREVFRGYEWKELQEIVQSRLGDHMNLIQREAVEFAARKVSSVNGDARRVLDICRRAFELAEQDASAGPDHIVTLQHVTAASSETTDSPMGLYLRGLPLASKIFLSAVLARKAYSRHHEDNPMCDILEETERLCKMSKNADKIMEVLFALRIGNKPQDDQTQQQLQQQSSQHRKIRMTGFQNAVAELIEGGVLVQLNTKGERSSRIRLSIAEEDVRSVLKDDPEVNTMV